MNARQEFDYIIVGAGSAGCVFAARLSQDPNVWVADVLDFDQRMSSISPGDTVNLDVWRILGPSVDAFTIKVALPSAGQKEPILKSLEQRALRLEEASEI